MVATSRPNVVFRVKAARPRADQTSVRTCPACSAAAPATSSWCSQCYTVFAPATVAAVATAPLPPPPPSAAAGLGVTPPGWAPTAPLTPVATAAPGSDASPPLPHRAFVLTLVSIGVGAVAMGVSYALSRSDSIAPATYIRYALVLTLAVYAVVGVLVVTQITPAVRLRWSDGKPALGVATGLLVGGGLSMVLLLLLSSASGHIDPDPRIVSLMSEGDTPHILAAVLLTCVAAPLVEEVLFRGLLLESQRYRGTAAAIWLSAIAFAVWHLNPAALRYYALMGALLGWLYTRRGLACSMAAHVGFNGVLTVAALSVVLSPGATLSVDGLSAQLPSGWKSVSSSQLPASLAFAGPVAGYRGPSGSALVVISLPTPVAPSVDDAYDRLSRSGLAAVMPGRTQLHELRLPAGPAVEVVADYHGDDLTVVLLPHAGRSYEILLHGAGSLKARSDFERILKALQVS